VIDRRASGGGRAIGGIGGIGGIILLLAIIWMGGDPTQLMQEMDVGGTPGAPVELSPIEEERAQFVSVVLADTEDVWNQLFSQIGADYREPNLVLFKDSVSSACGFASAATGPFYCPGDSQVYIDLEFFDEMAGQLQAGGDFAQAYVIAHEVGHHVQNLLGTADRVHAARGRVSEEEYNQLSVRLELQADFLAGVWAHHAERNFQILEQGDIEEALNAASAIGDDRLQRRSRGVVVPESFTHGTSAQRSRWFTRGLKTGDINQGNTFDIRYSEL
jgi:predicted metalloprotease